MNIAKESCGIFRDDSDVAFHNRFILPTTYKCLPQSVRQNLVAIYYISGEHLEDLKFVKCNQITVNSFAFHVIRLRHLSCISPYKILA